jgi:sRNA-binding regulator protein Hfq
MVFVLRDGETLRGVIEWYDKCCLKVNRDGAPNLLLYKPSIKYLYKDE